MITRWCSDVMGERDKIRMQQQEGKASRQKIRTAGKEARNSRTDSADRGQQSRRCRERADGHHEKRAAQPRIRGGRSPGAARSLWARPALTAWKAFWLSRKPTGPTINR